MPYLFSIPLYTKVTFRSIKHVEKFSGFHLPSVLLTLPSRRGIIINLNSQLLESSIFLTQFLQFHFFTASTEITIIRHTVNSINIILQSFLLEAANKRMLINIPNNCNFLDSISYSDKGLEPSTIMLRALPCYLPPDYRLRLASSGPSETAPSPSVLLWAFTKL